MRRPSFQFYPADWRKDPALSACSMAARGLWIELICIAHEGERYGHLAINGNAMTAQQLARMVGESVAAVNKLMAELEGAGVFSRTDEGVIYSRRMVKDEHIRNVRAESGRLGGNPDLLKQKVKQKPKQTGKQSTTPSSSSSSSEFSEPNGSDAAGVEKTKLSSEEIIFTYGLSLLTNAGSTEKQARSFLAGLMKAHGPDAVVDKLRDCIRAKPIEPLTWLAAALPPEGSAKAASRAPHNKHTAAARAIFGAPQPEIIDV